MTNTRSAAAGSNIVRVTAVVHVAFLAIGCFTIGCNSKNETAPTIDDDVANHCDFTSSCIATGVLPAEITCADGGLRLNCATP